ncbi:CBS domain-containing protein [Salipaludibacillus sp. CUR1]|uniref:CBS domain-containing protein n=1 Tax=Salipaludibacillus sp. CUR1 TaxID=2820003 RepID=UPI001E570EEA|nr:CBS domain-containing protein [Salipaludibacillus sp. CUR1]MCE7792963.1 CBS domain-containing protein [Salipaludibacillus sp. CUR1]
MYAKDIMTEDVIAVDVDSTVEQCAKLLYENNLSGVPVIDVNDQLVGIVTEGDLIKRASHIKSPAVLELLGGLIYLDNPNKFMDELKRAMSERVGDMMTKDVITIKPDDTIERTATIMVEKKIKRLPVVKSDGKLAGIVSRRDIMNHLYSTAED